MATRPIYYNYVSPCTYARGIGYESGSLGNVSQYQKEFK